MKLSMDELLLQLGNPGKVQMFVYILLCLNYFPLVANHLIMAVFGSKVPFHCNMTSVINIYSNESTDDTFTCDVPGFYPLTNQTEPCQSGWVFDTTEKTIVTEWDLVCDRKPLVALSTTLYFCGVMVGGLIFGFLADQFGRKPMIIFTLFSQIAVGVGISMSQSYVLFTSLRIIQGALMQGLQTVSIAMVMELFRPQHRSYAGATLEVFWGVSYVALAVIWYVIQDWRYIQLAVCLPSLLTISYIWLLPESLRWLILKKKFDKAEVLIKKMVKYNKILYPEETFNLVKTQISSMDASDAHRYTVLDLFKTPEIRKRTFILSYTWFATALGYYGLSLSTTHLKGDKFLIFFISGIVELPAYIASIYVLNKFGRKRPMSFFFILCGLTCIGAGIIRSPDPRLQQLSLALALIGKFSTAGLFSVVFLYAGELYPTVVRSVGCGACAFWMRAGGVAAPQILRLGMVTFAQLPIIIFGGVALLGGGLTLLLPETLNIRLPDKIEDVERAMVKSELAVAELADRDNSQLKPLTETQAV